MRGSGQSFVQNGVVALWGYCGDEVCVGLGRIDKYLSFSIREFDSGSEFLNEILDADLLELHSSDSFSQIPQAP
jgi:hypothetical protein